MNQDFTYFRLCSLVPGFWRDGRKSVEIGLPISAHALVPPIGWARVESHMANLGPTPLGGPIVITPGSGSIVLDDLRAALVGTHTPPAAPPEIGLILQTVVTPLGNTEDGDIVRAVAAPWLGIAQALLRDPDLAYKLDPRQLEE